MLDFAAAFIQDEAGEKKTLYVPGLQSGEFIKACEGKIELDAAESQNWARRLGFVINRGVRKRMLLYMPDDHPWQEKLDLVGRDVELNFWDAQDIVALVNLQGSHWILSIMRPGRDLDGNALLQMYTVDGLKKPIDMSEQDTTTPNCAWDNAVTLLMPHLLSLPGSPSGKEDEWTVQYFLGPPDDEPDPVQPNDSTCGEVCWLAMAHHVLGVPVDYSDVGLEAAKLNLLDRIIRNPKFRPKDIGPLPDESESGSQSSDLVA